MDGKGLWSLPRARTLNFFMPAPLRGGEAMSTTPTNPAVIFSNLSNPTMMTPHLSLLLLLEPLLTAGHYFPDVAVPKGAAKKKEILAVRVP